MAFAHRGILQQIHNQTQRPITLDRRLVRCLAKGKQTGKKKLTLTEKLRSNNAAPHLDMFEAPKPQSDDSGEPSTSGSGLPDRGLVAAVGSARNSNIVKVTWRRLLKELSSLPRAIAIMALIAGLSGLGTIIPQNKPLEYYIANYPAEGPHKVLGFLSYDVITALQLDHIYSADYFYLSMALLAASLTACTYTRQWPAVKVAQRWRFLTQPSSLTRQGRTEVLPNARICDLGALLLRRGYQVFLRGDSLYAFKGLAGKLGPIGVHAALLLCLLGTSWSGFGSLKGAVMCPEGQDFQVSSFLHPGSPLATMPEAASNVMHVNRFLIDYRPDGSVAQFYSDLSLTDPRDGSELLRKTISVNDPFRYKGVTMYQTDWSLSAVTLRVLGQDAPLARAAEAAAAAASTGEDTPAAAAAAAERTAFNLPMASLEGRPGVAGRLWATFLPLGKAAPDGSAPRGISILARDPQSVVFYDASGQFVGVRRPGSGKPITVEGLQLVVEDVVGATGLEIKSDPGVPVVYAGFGGLMVTTLVSYLSHSQVWALQQGSNLFVSGRTNRAKLEFETELDAILDQVPELRPAASEAVEGAEAETGGGMSRVAGTNASSNSAAGEVTAAASME
ncbi:hypothetical protein Agub_g9236 [Astrephomene gubernaculifera]|uniref:ResB-like domain-containing protein n=1 Tax=Astrephomene gubernaculifera TaxID=47775 RepID=A0AAD3DUU3_9CHLO|nr:hypothetical protein Agub_g9236 [Astrephomene gubernaculifera]